MSMKGGGQQCSPFFLGSTALNEPNYMNHITSPDHSDPGIERQILAKGLTAPRITPADIQAAIAGEYYFTAAQGCIGNVHCSPSDEHLKALDLLTFCTLVLKNGFTVTGESACASPENFDAEVGRNIARTNAISKIWLLLGYQLKEKLFQAEQKKAEALANPGTVFVEDVDQFAILVSDWHAKKVAVLEHMLTVPPGTEMEITSEGAPTTVTLAADILDGFKAGVGLALIELGSLPFQAIAT